MFFYFILSDETKGKINNFENHKKKTKKQQNNRMWMFVIISVWKLLKN